MAWGLTEGGAGVGVGEVVRGVQVAFGLGRSRSRVPGASTHLGHGKRHESGCSWHASNRIRVPELDASGEGKEPCKWPGRCWFT